MDVFDTIEADLKNALNQCSNEISKRVASEMRAKYGSLITQIESSRVEMLKIFEVEKQIIHNMKAELLKDLRIDELLRSSETFGQDQQLRNEVSKLQKIQQIQNNKMYKLDIGGEHFSLSQSSLTRDPNSMLGSMFSGRFPVSYNEDGRVFIDRDGKLFHYIADYLRDGEFDMPDDLKVLNKLLKEVRFYSLEGMETAILEFMQGLEQNKPDTVDLTSPIIQLDLQNATPGIEITEDKLSAAGPDAIAWVKGHQPFPSTGKFHWKVLVVERSGKNSHGPSIGVATADAPHIRGWNAMIKSHSWTFDSYPYQANLHGFGQTYTLKENSVVNSGDVVDVYFDRTHGTITWTINGSPIEKSSIRFSGLPQEPLYVLFGMHWGAKIQILLFENVH